MTVQSHRPPTQTARQLGNVLGSAGVSSAYAGKLAEQLNAEHDAWRDQQPTVTTCARCGWRHVGLAGDGRAAFKQHLAAQHPEVKKTRRRFYRTGFNKGDSTERLEALVVAERRAAERREAAEATEGKGS